LKGEDKNTTLSENIPKSNIRIVEIKNILDKFFFVKFHLGREVNKNLLPSK
jgi:hypothetical protein